MFSVMKKAALVILLAALIAPSVGAEVIWDGFVQGLFGGRLDDNNPTATEYTASETRLQLRAAHYGDRGEFFGRMDFFYDGADSSRYDWELREAFLKFRLGSNFDLKIGRQILTWGTGDLIFINDVFAKDYRSFFVGRDDQYLKAPQNALRIEYYHNIGSLTLVFTPRFEPNRLPTGRRLSYFNPMADSGRGAIVGEGYFFAPPTPAAKFENSEIAAKFQRQVGTFALAGYAYKGFYKNPRGFDPATMMPFFPELNIYGASVRGTLQGGVLWLEGGYFDSRQDRDGIDPFIPNSQMTGMVGYERQVASNLTANLQWQAEYMLDHDNYKAERDTLGGYIRDEVRHLLTSRWTKLLYSELVTLSLFGFYSPTDEDYYIRFSAAYKYTDELELMAGGNVFDGTYESTEFGQFQLNDNLYVKLTYGFY